MVTANEARAEMTKINRALAAMRVHLAGADQAAGARDLLDAPIQSPLRTLVEQAEDGAKRVMDYLRRSEADVRRPG